MSVGRDEKFAALREAVTYRPKLGAVIVALSLFTALLEGVGVGFILPVVEFAQSTPSTAEADGLLGLFVRAYALLDVPFSLEYLIAGASAVVFVRFTTSFVVGWLRAVLNTSYQRSLRQQLFERIAYAPVTYIDDEGSDDLLNSIVTEAHRSGGAAAAVFTVVDIALRGLIYLAIAFVISPRLTLVALVGLAASTLFVRFVLEPAYAVGDEVAGLNSRIQTVAQTAIQGARDVRLFNLRSEQVEEMRETLDEFVDVRVRYLRNKTALGNFNQLTNALVVFGLVYVGIRLTALSIAEIGVFLVAVYRLSPVATQLNETVYMIGGQLPHLVRVQARLDELDATAENTTAGGEPVDSVDRLAFENVRFGYDGDDRVLRGVTFDLERGEHVALVGQSGAGKSTVVSLLGRLQTPDSGQILADGTPIDAFDLTQWRERLAVVRQNPYIFDTTLRENVTVGRRTASQREIEHACEIAQVTEFLDELPEGYETELGEDGVRLSGGQKQRVALARALLKDADVLVLDEATSELDSNIEQRVHDNIDEVEDRYATISIAHRLSTAADADRIYTLVDGTVAEAGTHDELVESGGVYATLYATQS
ncbi:ABC transporter ATP-binding protein [Halosimplex salinum]|uniref:ABC transporter ATP-binding protein n=1 Tax=Halosimplex salinum TaxID=1710538 RepID=UPI000F46FC57|nr:ABC transporter ATP-binding protein [Halosimplex salinum]